MALASLGRLGQRAILGQSWILGTLQGRLGQCGILSSRWTGMDTHWISMALASVRQRGILSSGNWDNRHCPGWAETHWDNLDVDGYPWAMPWLARVSM